MKPPSRRIGLALPLLLATVWCSSGQNPPAPNASAPSVAAPAANPAPPPSTAAKRGANELEKLVAPIALIEDSRP